MSSHRPIATLALVCTAVLVGLGGSACSSEVGPEATPTPGGPATTAADLERATDQPGREATSGSGSASLTVGDEQWTFDDVTCGFGEEGTGVEGATWNMAARNGPTSLYATIEPDLTSIELGDLEDPGAPNLMTTGEVTIDLDGATARGSGTFIDVNGDPGAARAGTLEVTCP